ncbi:MAG: F0F1 ATP synthase subunit delta [Dehalococcoidia bacterium]|nr:F0F1 ATP synthase subunit delta [Dehalococcoidia bacterium]
MPKRGASAKRYAQAVFEIAQAGNTLDRWQGDLADLAQLGAHAQFCGMVESPRMAVAARREAFHKVLPQASDMAINLALLLAGKGRLQALAGQIAQEYGRLLDSQQGIVRAEVVTAVALGKAQSDRIGAELGAALGRDVRVTLRVDAALGGGMVIRVGDRVLDGSVRSKLAGLRKSLAQQMVS